jgi:hypothetical protein
MIPENERSRPAQAASPDEHAGGGHVENIVGDPADLWRTVRIGWCRAGDSMPQPGSPAWTLLDDGDPVKVSATAATNLDAVRRHGPGWAELLAEVAG